MQVSVERVSPIERRLTITIPVGEVDEAYEKQIDQLAKKANIKGFRPGKAPLSYIKERFGDDARKEALGEVIQRTLYQAITEQNLNPVSTPRIEPKMTLPNQPLEFVATFEVLPEIDTINFKMDQVEKLVVDVKPEDIDHVIQQLMKQYTKWSVVDREAQNHDRVVIDYYAIYEGKADTEHKIENFPLELGSNSMLPGFEAGLIGVKAGEQRTLNLQFPADFHVAERAGKPIDFVVDVKQVFTAEKPVVDEEFVKRLGIKSGTEDDLKQQIKQSLEQERDRLVKENLKEQVFRQLLEQNSIDVPQSLIAREAKHIHDEVYQNQQHDHHGHSDEEMAKFNDIAKKRVMLGLLIAEFAKKSSLHVDAARVKQRIEEIAAVYENPAEVVEWLSGDERRSGIEAQVMEDQVLDKLIEGVAVTDKNISYAELKGIRI